MKTCCAPVSFTICLSKPEIWESNAHWPWYGESLPKCHTLVTADGIFHQWHGATTRDLLRVKVLLCMPAIACLQKLVHPQLPNPWGHV
jgi:hypothetical protein